MNPEFLRDMTRSKVRAPVFRKSTEELTYDWMGQTHVMMSPDISDFVVAGRVRMLMRDQLDHEAVCTLARDRIMALSKRIVELEAELHRVPA